VIDDGDKFVIEEGAELVISYGTGAQLEFVSIPVRRWYQVQVKNDNVYRLEKSDPSASE